MLLHNFIKDEGIDESEDSDWRPRPPQNANSEHPFPLVTDNDEELPRGRRTGGQDSDRAKGETVRRNITVELQAEELRRPLHSGMHYNQYGHVFFDG